MGIASVKLLAKLRANMTPHAQDVVVMGAVSTRFSNSSRRFSGQMLRLSTRGHQLEALGSARRPPSTGFECQSSLNYCQKTAYYRRPALCRADPGPQAQLTRPKSSEDGSVGLLGIRKCSNSLSTVQRALDLPSSDQMSAGSTSVLTDEDINPSASCSGLQVG